MRDSKLNTKKVQTGLTGMASQIFENSENVRRNSFMAPLTDLTHAIFQRDLPLQPDLTPGHAGASREKESLFRRLSAVIESQSTFQLILYVGALLVSLLILSVPGYLILRIVQGWQAASETLARPATMRVLGNSLLLTGSVTLLSTAIALPLAWLTGRTDLPGRRVWATLSALPLVIPSYIYAFLFISFFAPKGLFQKMIGPLLGVEKLPSVYGFFGALVVITLVTYPYIFLMVRAALVRLDPAIEEAAAGLGATRWVIFRRIILPYLRPSLVAGGLLVALYALRDFGAVTLLQFSTFTRVIFTRYQSFRLDEAATLATMLIIVTVVILFFEGRSRKRFDLAVQDEACTRRPQILELGHWRWPALIFVGFVVTLSLFMPVGVLLYWIVRGFIQDGMAQQTVSLIGTNTMGFATMVLPAGFSIVGGLIATAVALLLGLPIAILSVRYPGRLSTFFERLTYTGFALPGIVVALAFVYFSVHFARPLYQTLPLLIAAYVVLFIPKVVSAQRSALLQVPKTLEEAGSGLGASPFTVFRRITLPLLRSGLTAAGLLIFMAVMKELPATLMLSPLGYDTLPAAIWTNINEAFFAKAAMPTLVLLLISAVPLALSTIEELD